MPLKIEKFLYNLLNSMSVFVSGLQTVFQKISSWIIATLGGGFFIVLVVVFTQLQVLRYVFTAPTFTSGDKMRAFFASFGTLQTNFELTQQIILVVSALLFGVTIASVVFYARRQFKAVRSAGFPLFGAVVGILGVGCSACGSVIITAVLGTSASVFVAKYFPLQGLEFSLVGLLIMGFALHTILKKIVAGGVCQIGDTRR